MALLTSLEMLMKLKLIVVGIIGFVSVVIPYCCIGSNNKSSTSSPNSQQPPGVANLAVPATTKTLEEIKKENDEVYAGASKQIEANIVGEETDLNIPKLIVNIGGEKIDIIQQYGETLVLHLLKHFEPKNQQLNLEGEPRLLDLVCFLQHDTENASEVVWFEIIEYSKVDEKKHAQLVTTLLVIREYCVYMKFMDAVNKLDFVVRTQAKQNLIDLYERHLEKIKKK